jgi:hypothetical protein
MYDLFSYASPDSLTISPLAARDSPTPAVPPPVDRDMTALYSARPVNRKRRTRTELAELDELIIEVIEQDYPVSLRGVYYRIASAGGVDKTEHAYRAVRPTGFCTAATSLHVHPDVPAFGAGRRGHQSSVPCFAGKP